MTTLKDKLFDMMTSNRALNMRRYSDGNEYIKDRKAEIDFVERQVEQFSKDKESTPAKEARDYRSWKRSMDGYLALLGKNLCRELWNERSDMIKCHKAAITWIKELQKK